MRKAIVAGVLILLVARTLAAQPTTLMVTPLVVVPGTGVVALITGPPGYAFALVGSPTGADNPATVAAGSALQLPEMGPHQEPLPVCPRAPSRCHRVSTR
jgi:hypothetical protein